MKRTGQDNIMRVFYAFCLAVALIFLFAFTSCQTLNNPSYVQTVSTTNETITFVATKVKKACEQGEIKPEDCARAKDLYQKIRAVDNRIIDLTVTAIKLGDEDFKTSTAYQEALSELTLLVNKFIETAVELNLIGGTQ